ncbi:MAG TPA: phage major capsid protein [Anaerolineaceae bacterium]|nr:phage major capsid protein [Anaerolineaceae bacterium]
MPYNNIISRTDAAALIPEEVSNAILNQVAGGNPLMSLARRLPNMARNQTRLPVMSSLATAYFVAGDHGLKQTSEVNWENKYIDAEELAVIVPIPQAVLDDADYDVWGQVQPELVNAFQLAIAQAVLFGTNIPASWTTNLGAAGIFAGATAAGQALSLAAYADAYEAILGETAAGVDGIYMAVEADGFAVNGNLAHPSMKGILRNTRDINGNPIFKTSMQDVTRYELDGAPIYFPADGSIVAATALMFSGDWSQLIYAMRQDITYKVLDQAVIQDNAGTIVYNLAQQDMVALRAVMRLGFALPNPINRMNQTAATRYPFAALTA